MTLWEKLKLAFGALFALACAAVLSIGVIMVALGVPLVLLALFIGLVKFIWVHV